VAGEAAPTRRRVNVSKWEPSMTSLSVGRSARLDDAGAKSTGASAEWQNPGGHFRAAGPLPPDRGGRDGASWAVFHDVVLALAGQRAGFL
jgi:hypothetical protein